MSMWICIFRQRQAREREAIGVFTHILREASASLLVLSIRALRRPQRVERAMVWLSRFFR